MIGWWIVVSTQTPEERDRADQDARRAAISAQWEAGAGGIDWLSALTKAGKAEQHTYSGYPNRYTACAIEVLPRLKGGGIAPTKDGIWIIGIDEGEEYAQPPGWMGKIEVHVDRVATCPGDQLVTIDAWDQS